MNFCGNCLCLIVIKCIFAKLNYKHKLRKITAEYWQREVTNENHILFLFLHTLSSQVLQGTDWILGSLGSRTTTRDSNATPLLWIYIKITKKNCMTWNFPLPRITINIVLSQASIWVSQTPKYKGQSNENLKSVIKIWNTAWLSCNLTTMMLMVWRLAARWQYDAGMQHNSTIVVQRFKVFIWLTLVYSNLCTGENLFAQQYYPTIITNSSYFVKITNMKTAKDSTRPKGNSDGPTLGQSSCFGRKKIGIHFLLRVW